MKHLLFVTEKFCDGKPLLSFTNNFHNMFNSFSREEGDSWSFNTIHIDEAFEIYKADVNKVIVDYVDNNKTDLVVFCLLGGYAKNPSGETFSRLKSLGIKSCIIWPDTGPEWGMQTIEQIADTVDLHVSWDNPRSPWHDSYTKRKNHIFLWTPEDESLFYPTIDKPVDVSFLGSIEKYRDRIPALIHLQETLPNTFISGGQRSSKLSPSEYSKIIRNSKIGINFPLSQTGVFYQAKGRIFEYTSCGGLLMDFENPSTRDFFTPGVDYVEFSNAKELVDKIKYYLHNSSERIKIAERGLKTFAEKWTAKKYWKELLKNLNL